ncbi:hypothetical protein FGB62_9g010 [Gracilaria domingensis]|nr:hypothetical protein FGB62_9g010 [Gracilaria domingensis]
MFAEVESGRIREYTLAWRSCQDRVRTGWRDETTVANRVFTSTEREREQTDVERDERRGRTWWKHNMYQVGQTADPVSKLAIVGCLATLGSDQKNKDEVVARRSQTAFRILLSVCNADADMIVAATALGALAQIAQNASPAQKQAIITHLQCLSDRSNSDDQSGFNYVQEMARSPLDQLQGASAASNLK